VHEYELQTFSIGWFRFIGSCTNREMIVNGEPLKLEIAYLSCEGDFWSLVFDNYKYKISILFSASTRHNHFIFVMGPILCLPNLDPSNVSAEYIAA
jgi:hypothetical protein